MVKVSHSFSSALSAANAAPPPPTADQKWLSSMQPTVTLSAVSLRPGRVMAPILALPEWLVVGQICVCRKRHGLWELLPLAHLAGRRAD